MPLLQLFSLTLCLFVSGACLAGLAYVPFLAIKLADQRAEMLMLKASFAQRVPDQWPIWDGEGRI